MFNESQPPRGGSALQTLPLADPIVSAKAAGLRYVTDTGPCIRRVRHGKQFRYIGPDGKSIRDEAELRRIRALGIPPAWTKVWICPNPNGHIQATGRDAKGRKQYRYHTRWREVRDETKFNRMLEFGATLPLLRERTERDLALPGLPRERVLAAVVRLLEGTLIRVGNEEYARQNGSFGLTTMRDWHVDISGSTLRFHFLGKSGKEHNVDIRDRRLARIVKRCQDIPGHELFQYLDSEGQRHTIGSADVNDYLRGITGHDFTAKDFRTWAGTVLASLALQEFEAFDSQTQAKKNVVQAIKAVAEKLGNTPAICRKCYIHPAILEAYADGTMLETLKHNAEQAMMDSIHSLRPEEAAVMAFLQERLKQEVNRREHLAETLEKSVVRLTASRRDAKKRRDAKDGRGTRREAIGSKAAASRSSRASSLPNRGSRRSSRVASAPRKVLPQTRMRGAA